MGLHIFSKINERGVWQRANRVICRMSGRRVKELSSLNLGTLYHSTDWHLSYLSCLTHETLHLVEI